MEKEPHVFEEDDEAFLRSLNALLEEPEPQETQAPQDASMPKKPQVGKKKMPPKTGGFWKKLPEMRGKIREKRSVQIAHSAWNKIDLGKSGMLPYRCHFETAPCRRAAAAPYEPLSASTGAVPLPISQGWKRKPVHFPR